MTRQQRERIAKILIETVPKPGWSQTKADHAAAKKHKVSLRSIYRWRNALKTDRELAALVSEKAAKVEERWLERVPEALNAAVDFLKRATEEGDPKDPRMVEAVSRSMKDLAEVASTWKVLSVRLDRQIRPDSATARPVASGGEARRAGSRGAGGLPN